MQRNLTTAQIAKALESWAPTAYAESYDNVGLLVGLPDQVVTGILVTLDMTEEVLDEAKALGCNMVVAHHPIWFTPRKRLNGEDYVSRTIMKAVKDDIALYACHTNLDAVSDGVNAMIGKRIGAKNLRSLSAKRDVMLGMVVTGEELDLDAVSIEIQQQGVRNLHFQRNGAQSRMEFTIPSPSKSTISNIIQRHSPSANWHSFSTQEAYLQAGSGMIGELEEAMSKEVFLAHIKKQFGCGGIRYADANLTEIKRVAWCGGAGSFLISAAMRAGADAFVTADITYHKFFDSENRMLLLDIGHFESEQFTSELITHHLLEKFPNFAVRLSKVITNPVKYY